MNWKRLFPIRTLPFRVARNALRHVLRGSYWLIIQLPRFRFVRDTRNSTLPRTLSMYLAQHILGFNRKAYWPVHFTSKINQPENIVVGIDSCPGYEPGCYIQGLGKILIGDYTAIAQNVGIVSANHTPEDISRHDKGESVEIGSYCWIGMNSVILPGVHLGDFTVVGAGSVVTKSFVEGYCIIAGNPAKLIRRLDREKCVRHRSSFEYVGYIPAGEFADFRRRRLWV